MANTDFTVKYETRLCTVNGETGLFHIWENYSRAMDGLASAKVNGIVEFVDGVRRVDPEDIRFCDETNVILGAMDTRKEETA
ncbi:MAG: hypothetical protein NC120_12395 [Ruminococcus sp.]|nr:hypothetical protein [Ruminococcus sp.]